MRVAPSKSRANVIPCPRYADAPRAIEWLCDTFGFEQHLVVPGEDNTVRHAQLSFGNGMIMLGSSTRIDNEYGKLMKQPADIGGASTQSICMVVEDADAVYANAAKAGCEMIMDIRDEDYGGRSFTCRDLEGHIWTFGTYDPFADTHNPEE